MLQQTTVTAVKPYFERFLAQFPDVQSLANAREEDVLRLWEGLGYYSRARNLHRAAQILVERHSGNFPKSIEELLTLPGIGRYTAGAIVSFAFDMPAPILEANTLRLYCRLLGFRGDPRSTFGQKRLWAFAESLVPTKTPGEFNQALMDLGATVCTPTEPCCDGCPVASRCLALAENSVGDIPQPARRPEITEVREAAIAIESDGRFLLIRRPEGVRWAGLWDFPRFEVTEQPHKRSSAVRRHNRKQKTPSEDGTTNELEQRIATEFTLVVRLTERLTQLKHSVTRYRITLDCWHAECAASCEVSSQLTTAWVSPNDFAQYPLSVTGRKFANLMQKRTFCAAK